MRRLLLSQSQFLGLLLFGLLGGLFTLGALVAGFILDNRLALVEESRDRSELERMLALTNLAHLQNQVRPHFLFNVLNSVARLCDLGRPEEASRAVLALSDLLRQGLFPPDRLVTLQDEMDLVNSYTAIQSLRYGDRIGVMLEVPAELLDTPIPPLTVQPLVENAYMHGLEPRPGKGSIWLAVSQNQGLLTISVADDGIGIDPDRARGQGAGVGLRSIRGRLQLFYGPAAALSVTPRAGGGTLALIVIPLNAKSTDQTRGGV